MRFVYYLIVLPIIAIVAWLLYGISTSEEGIAFAQWPQDCIKPQIVLIIALALGYILGKLNSWFNYLPLRYDLKQQMKTNKVLNIEQEKLNHAVNDLKLNIAGLQEKVAANPEIAVVTETKTVAGFFEKLRKKLGLNRSKKGN
ncbi:MAG: hypothetical protein IJ778_04665 [Alphaproteobacteria bacterium]|nr:hypothetical protein [Alphaproteobacteria bacterium]